MQEFPKEVVTTTTVESMPGGGVRRATVVTPTTTTTQPFEQVSSDPYAARRLTLFRLQQAISSILVFINGLIAIRFILRLLGANADAGFAQLIYGLTAPLVAPFVGLFGTPRFEGSAFEVTSLVAMLVYALLAWAIVKVVFMFFGVSRTGRLTRRTDTRFQ